MIEAPTTRSATRARRPTPTRSRRGSGGRLPTAWFTLVPVACRWPRHGRASRSGRNNFRHHSTCTCLRRSPRAMRPLLQGGHHRSMWWRVRAPLVVISIEPAASISTAQPSTPTCAECPRSDRWVLANTKSSDTPTQASDFSEILWLTQLPHCPSRFHTWQVNRLVRSSPVLRPTAASSVVIGAVCAPNVNEMKFPLAGYAATRLVYCLLPPGPPRSNSATYRIVCGCPRNYY
jgi:hypothetical protein